MNGLEPVVILYAALLAVLVVYGLRDGLLVWSLIRRVLSAGATPAPVVAVPAVRPPPVPQPVPGPVPGKPPPVVPAAAKPRFTGITATSFAGGNDSVDSRTSAYDGKLINGDTELAAALSFHFPGTPPVVRVFYNGRTADVPVRDVGPWNTHDPYWQTAGARPQAETGTDTTGRKTNHAGLDLSPLVWTALGYAGDPRNATGKVDWDFVSVLDASAPPPSVNSTEPAWLTAARAEIGFHEGPDNTNIGRYTSLAGYGAEHDPWCAIFAGAMLRKAGVPIPGVNAMARSFSTSPAFVQLSAPRMGCVVVFWRGSKSGDSGHVGFWVGEDATRVQTLGGNENDSVMIEAIPKAGSSMGLLGYWWPAQPSASPAAEPNLA